MREENQTKTGVGEDLNLCPVTTIKNAFQEYNIRIRIQNHLGVGEQMRNQL